MSIRARLTIAFLVISLLPLTIVSIISWVTANRAIREGVLDHVKSVATIQAHRLEAIVQQDLERLSLVGSRTQLRALLNRYNRDQDPDDVEAMNKILVDALDSIPDFEQISVLDLQGTVIASTSEGEIGEEFGRQAFFRSGRERPHLEIISEEGAEKIGLRLTGPLVLSDEIIGVLVIRSHAQNILALVSDYAGLGRTGETVVAKAGSGGEVTFLTPLRNDPEAAFTTVRRNSGALLPIERAVAGEEVLLDGAVDYGGRRVLAATRYVRLAGWGLVAKMDRDEALAPVRELRHVTLIAIFGTALLTAIIATSISNSISGPIVELTAVAERISDGALDERVRIGSQDEIGTLSQAFDDMADMLVDANLSLERSVEERTADLHAEIEQHKATQEQLREARDVARNASKAKSEFLANMSHELRTPMNGIIGMTELALDTDLSTEQREYLQMVRDSAEVLLRLLNDILDASKIEAGKLELEHTEFRLRESLGDTLRVLAVRAYDKSLELAYRIAPDVPDHLVGDPWRLRQIVVNLVGNAIKFTDEGEVVVEVEEQERANRHVVLHFAIRDTGIGIPAEEQGRVLEAFTQADSSTTRRYGGTGLGLTISSQLVGLMGGRMWLESQPGVGSTFHFTVRLEVAEAKDELPEWLDAEGLRVLIVDDNATNRRILEEILSSWHIHSVSCEGGPCALEALVAAEDDDRPFNAALIDMMMPEMDGVQLAEQIRTDPRIEHTALIILSSAMPGEMVREASLQADRLLLKPVKQSELLDALLVSLRTRSAEHPEAPQVTARDLPPPARPLQVLVAEDNPVNQRLVIRTLEKRGHHVHAVGDGLAAVEASADGGFDVIVMDVQMPTMDGFEATAAIRERERVEGGHIPVVAMTAHALAEDRDRCLAAGMDAYISKPLSGAMLITTVEAAAAGETGAAAACDPERPTLIDSDAILQRMMGDRELLSQMVELFASAQGAMVERCREAIAGGDHEALQRAAHALKGMIGNFETGRAYELAQRLETIGKENIEIDEASLVLADLERQIVRLQDALLALREEKR